MMNLITAAAAAKTTAGSGSSGSSESESESETRYYPREEIQFIKLLQRVQEYESEGAATGRFNWRLDPFLSHLSRLLETLETHPQGPSKAIIKEYRGKLDFLVKVFEAHRLEDDDYFDYDLERRQENPRPVSRKKKNIFIEEDVKDDFPTILPHGPSVTSETIEKEIHQKTIERFSTSERQELFGVPDSELRQRFTKENSEIKPNEIDSLIKAHHVAQEQIAEEMLILTRSLKEQSLAAKKIIQKDIAKLESSNALVDDNTVKLATENERLQEHTKFSCRCWIWVLLVVVAITFITMVWVMKFFRKRVDVVT